MTEWKCEVLSAQCLEAYTQNPELLNYLIPFTDLREEYVDIMAAGDGPVEVAWMSALDDSGFEAPGPGAVALFVPSSGRIGIASGADADWADCASLEEGIEMEMYIIRVCSFDHNDLEEFVHRN